MTEGTREKRSTCADADLTEARYIRLRHDGKSSTDIAVIMGLSESKRQRLEGHYRQVAWHGPDDSLPDRLTDATYVALILRARAWGFVQPRDVGLTRAQQRA